MQPQQQLKKKHFVSYSGKEYSITLKEDLYSSLTCSIYDAKSIGKFIAFIETCTYNESSNNNSNNSNSNNNTTTTTTRKQHHSLASSYYQHSLYHPLIFNVNHYELETQLSSFQNSKNSTFKQKANLFLSNECASTTTFLRFDSYFNQMEQDSNLNDREKLNIFKVIVCQMISSIYFIQWHYPNTHLYFNNFDNFIIILNDEKDYFKPTVKLILFGLDCDETGCPTTIKTKPTKISYLERLKQIFKKQFSESSLLNNNEYLFSNRNQNLYEPLSIPLISTRVIPIHVFNTKSYNPLNFTIQEINGIFIKNDKNLMIELLKKNNNIIIDQYLVLVEYFGLDEIIPFYENHLQYPIYSIKSIYLILKNIKEYQFPKHSLKELSLTSGKNETVSDSIRSSFWKILYNNSKFLNDQRLKKFDLRNQELIEFNQESNQSLFLKSCLIFLQDNQKEFANTYVSKHIEFKNEKFNRFKTRVVEENKKIQSDVIEPRQYYENLIEEFKSFYLDFERALKEQFKELVQTFYPFVWRQLYYSIETFVYQQYINYGSCHSIQLERQNAFSNFDKLIQYEASVRNQFQSIYQHLLPFVSIENNYLLPIPNNPFVDDADSNEKDQMTTPLFYQNLTIDYYKLANSSLEQFGQTNDWILKDLKSAEYQEFMESLKTKHFQEKQEIETMVQETQTKQIIIDSIKEEKEKIVNLNQKIKEKTHQAMVQGDSLNMYIQNNESMLASLEKSLLKEKELFSDQYEKLCLSREQFEIQHKKGTELLDQEITALDTELKEKQDRLLAQKCQYDEEIVKLEKELEILNEIFNAIQ
ncbi:hypothetical protein CYY_002620 [Polysphondylium violaceum]|uniref:Uncharacterized protein n=1 Tax=Polysphondylium violaceum TaxID=133409 RepID=A0A8J4PY48_9MYCE|nr:hypothetical protein CYY_002620 [Polysphondylium violaceum]